MLETLVICNQIKIFEIQTAAFDTPYLDKNKIMLRKELLSRIYYYVKL